MEITDEVGKAISAEVPEDQLRKIAVQEGMTPLREAALQKVRSGYYQYRRSLAKNSRPQGKPSRIYGESR